MKDKFGNELEVGDKVVYVERTQTSYGIYKGTIFKLNKKMATISTERHNQCKTCRYYEHICKL